jgi:hypothetical protein
MPSLARRHVLLAFLYYGIGSLLGHPVGFARDAATGCRCPRAIARQNRTWVTGCAATVAWTGALRGTAVLPARRRKGPVNGIRGGQSGQYQRCAASRCGCATSWAKPIQVSLAHGHRHRPNIDPKRGRCGLGGLARRLSSSHAVPVVDMSEDPRGTHVHGGSAGWYFPAMSRLVPCRIGSDGRDH